jgi:uncharacterized integral membrane protein
MNDPTQLQHSQPRKEGVGMRQWALWIAIALVAIIALQNSQEVPVDFLFIHISAPLILVLLLTACLGAVVGYAAPVLRRHRREERRRDEEAG